MHFRMFEAGNTIFPKFSLGLLEANQSRFCPITIPSVCMCVTDIRLWWRRQSASTITVKVVQVEEMLILQISWTSESAYHSMCSARWWTSFHFAAWISTWPVPCWTSMKKTWLKSTGWLTSGNSILALLRYNVQHTMFFLSQYHFGCLQSSDGEELVRLVQIDNPSQFACFPMVSSSQTGPSEELHDRLPSYYTALASSRSAPWIPPPASQQVFNKLPAYITDIAPLDGANCGNKLNQKFPQ